MTKPIAPDTLIERLRYRLPTTVIARATAIEDLELANEQRAEAADALEANNRQLQLCREALRLARGIIAEDAAACRAFRHESEGPSGPENVLAEIDKVLASIEGVGE